VKGNSPYYSETVFKEKHGVVAEAYVVTKREPVKYCTCILVGGLTVGNRDTYVSWPPRMRSNAVGGGGGISVAWDVAVMMPLQGSPQASRSEA
jgi:hypothetical protein